MTGVKLFSDQCQTCVFRPGNLMDLRTGRLADLVKSNRDAGAALVCHETTDDDVDDVLCRGFYDAYGDETVSIQIYRRLGGVFDVVPPPTKEV